MRQPNTTLCYLERDGQYLMLHRVKRKEDLNAGKWLGIGGHFEEGETPEECMRREVFEETGYTVGNYRFRGIVTFVPHPGETEYMHLFTTDDFRGEMHPCDEGDLLWVAKEEVPRLGIWEGDRIFLDLILRDTPFFSLKLVYDGDRLTEAVLNGEPLPLK